MRLTRRSRHRPIRHGNGNGEGQRRAAAAVVESERALAASARRTSEVHSLGAQLRELRMENNFSLRLQWMLRESGEGHHDRG